MRKGLLLEINLKQIKSYIWDRIMEVLRFSESWLFIFTRRHDNLWLAYPSKKTKGEEDCYLR